jgi:hypothetical protein
LGDIFGIGNDGDALVAERLGQAQMWKLAQVKAYDGLDD